jgi:hypothetical protein
VTTQPTYLRNLKQHARELYGPAAGAKAELADLSAESDRGAIILMATTIEDVLEQEIVGRFRNLHDDMPARKKMFEADGILSTFSSKIDMAYAIGLIDKDYRSKIHLIREIRNACAHSRKPLSFKDTVLLKACHALMPEIWPYVEGQPPTVLRFTLYIKCNFIMMYVLTGKRYDTLAAQTRLLRGAFKKAGVPFPGPSRDKPRRQSSPDRPPKG